MCLFVSHCSLVLTTACLYRSPTSRVFLYFQKSYQTHPAALPFSTFKSFYLTSSWAKKYDNCRSHGWEKVWFNNKHIRKLRKHIRYCYTLIPFHNMEQVLCFTLVQCSQSICSAMPLNEDSPTGMIPYLIHIDISDAHGEKLKKAGFMMSRRTSLYTHAESMKPTLEGTFPIMHVEQFSHTMLVIHSSYF